MRSQEAARHVPPRPSMKQRGPRQDDTREGAGTGGRGGSPAQYWGDLTLLHRTQELTEPLAQLKNIPEELQHPIPEALLQLSTKSMQSLRGATLNPRTVSLVDMGLDDGDSYEQLEFGASAIAMGLKRSPISPLRDSVPIAACAASTAKIGETNTVMILAIRAVAVCR